MLKVEHLTKFYGTHQALDDVSFEIEEGHVYGFLGPNGAGKSTAMNIMTGCLSMTEGKVTVDGHDIFTDAKEAKKLIGYLPEIPPLYLDLTVHEYLAFVASAKGVRGSEVDEQVDMAVQATGTRQVEHRLIRNLSKGYKQRVGIAQAILGNPRLIILDEPTVGLDPIQIIEIRDLIKSLGEKHTVILSSHILSEVQEICEKVLIISHGKLLAFDTPENLEKMLKGDAAIELRVSCSKEHMSSVLSSVKSVKSYDIEEIADGCRAIVKFEGEHVNASKELFGAFAAAGIPIFQMSQTQSSLEKIFVELTEEEEKEAKEAAAAEAAAKGMKPVAPVVGNIDDAEAMAAEAADIVKSDDANWR